MPISLPNLDDRRFADLVEEARGLLIAQAPTLTNHNPSDPAITMIELFAYFTEVLLFRLNNITDANRIKFLQLLNGPDFKVPQPPDLSSKLDALERDTVLLLRTSDRAVTSSDFETLSLAADPVHVARAHCLPDRNLEATDATQRKQSQPSHVSVVIVPAAGAKLDAVSKTVRDFLEPRRLLTSRVHVVGPRLVPIRVQLSIQLLPDSTKAQMLPKIGAALTTFLDPIVGGDGTGWVFGRNVYVSEIYRLLDALPGVDFVSRKTNASGTGLDELLTDAAFSERPARNADGDLVSIGLDPDELVQFDLARSVLDVIEPLPPV
jgi:hypothetical protein